MFLGGPFSNAEEKLLICKARKVMNMKGFLGWCVFKRTPPMVEIGNPSKQQTLAVYLWAMKASAPFGATLVVFNWCSLFGSGLD